MEKNQFSFDTINDFDSHINLSIPGYSNLLNHIICISSYFLKEGTTMYDFGCSTGSLILELQKANKVNVNYIGVDKSENMSKNNDFILNENLVNFLPKPHIFSTLIFTLQFIEISERLAILKSIYNSLSPGGALIVSEKVFINHGFTQDILSFTYYDFKIKSFTSEEILLKQRDLRRIMTPLSEEENIALFKKAGFSLITPFWQSLQFKAWLLLK